MVTLLVVFQVLIALSMVAIILVQKGAGATAGASFGAGASATVFGSKGSGSFLTRTTAVLATLFFAITFFMAILASQQTPTTEQSDLGVMSTVVSPDAESADTAVNDAVEMPVSEDVPAMPVIEGMQSMEEAGDVPSLPLEVNSTEVDQDQPIVEKKPID